MAKLPPSSLESRQVTELLQSLDRPRRPSQLRRLATAMLVLAAALFLITNLFVGRWLVVLAILLISIGAFMILKAINRRR